LIFNLAVDGLARYACKLAEVGIIKGFSLSTRGNLAPILQYADDTVFFVEGSKFEAHALGLLVKIFGDISSLCLNKDKSILICFGMSEQEQRELEGVLRSPHAKLPLRYLGLPLRATKLKKSDWNVLFERVSGKLKGWSSKFLSKGGRLILLNSVITAIPIFYFSIFKATKCIWKRLDVMRKRFFWKGAGHEGGFMQPIKWSCICRPKEIGGLGIKALKEFNKALLLKWAIRILDGKEGLMEDLIRDCYGGSNSSLQRLQPKKPSPFWRSVISAVTCYWHLLQPKLRDGRGFSLWNEHWFDLGLLKEVYLRVYDAATDKEATVSSLWSQEEGCW
jgi:hypothetical protein